MHSWCAAGLLKAFLHDCHTQAVTFLQYAGSTSLIPNVSSRQQVILSATKQAVDASTSAEDWEKLYGVLAEGCSSLNTKELCDQALAYLEDTSREGNG